MKLTISLLNKEIESGLREMRKTTERIESLEKELSDARLYVTELDGYVADLQQSKDALEGKQTTVKIELDGKKIAESIGKSLMESYSSSNRGR